MLVNSAKFFVASVSKPRGKTSRPADYEVLDAYLRRHNPYHKTRAGTLSGIALEGCDAHSEAQAGQILAKQAGKRGNERALSAAQSLAARTELISKSGG
jgi:hypothetical protein